MRGITIGLLGCGNVGGGFWRLTTGARHHLAAHKGLTIDIRHVLVRDVDRPRAVQVPRTHLTTDVRRILEDPGIDIVVEAMGGFEPARTYLLEALRRGKHGVTANKVVMARAWDELHSAARAAGVGLYYEAAAGAVIPVIRSLPGLSAAPLRAVYGILNGTSNYILTRMAEGLSQAEALAEAQRLGYAEPDPSDDLDGRDAAYKIALLAALAFDWSPDPDRIQVEGIRNVGPDDILAAREAGLDLRHVARAEREPSGEVRVVVAPMELPPGDPLYGIRGVENAVVMESDVFGAVTLRGAGAGPGPTATALLGDVCRAAARLQWAVPSRPAASAVPAAPGASAVSTGTAAGTRWRGEQP
ncbi:MAG TPA: homoserine dehydrogenase [Bacillota bacterium]